jgi:hypothetical protein
VQVKEWREAIKIYRLTEEQDVISEAKLLIAESVADSSGE